MKQFYSQWITVIIMVISIQANGNCRSYRNRSFHSGVSLGLGLPKIPLSYYRSPISIMGGGMINIRIIRKVALQCNGYGLKTFSLGTVSNQKDRLRFDMVWGSLDILAHLRGVIQNEQFLLVGIGTYSLFQRFNKTDESVTTLGTCLGVSNIHYGVKMKTFFELRWHLLYNLDPKPQVLTVTYGLLF